MNKDLNRKLESLTDLPNGYNPNLDSKWDTLYTALYNREKQRKGIWKTKEFVAAAILIITLGTGIYLYFSPSSQIQTTANSTLLIYMPKHHESLNKENQIRQHKKVASKPVLNTDSSRVSLASDSSIDFNPSVVEDIQVAINHKRKRFVEIDFGDQDIEVPVYSSQTTNKESNFKIQFTRKHQFDNTTQKAEETSKTILTFNN
jgi:hypothetical protein